MQILIFMTLFSGEAKFDPDFFSAKEGGNVQIFGNDYHVAWRMVFLELFTRSFVISICQL